MIEWTERLAQGSKDPQFSAKTCPSQRSNTLEESQASSNNVGGTEGQHEPERGRPASLRPAGLALFAFELRKLHRLQEEITNVHAKVVARWPHS